MKKKLTLDLADLRIESFATAPAERAAGTVRGHVVVYTDDPYGSTCCDPTQADTCAASCGDTCGDSCGCSGLEFCPSGIYTACGLNTTCGPNFTEDYQYSCFCWN